VHRAAASLEGVGTTALAADDTCIAAAARTAPLGHRAALDGVRALSVLAVMGFHCLLFPGGGFLGVDVFFVLSGFLITNLLLEERDATGRLDLRRFYMRRARRLLPPLLVAVAGFLAIAAVADADNYRTDVVDALAGATYLSNVLIATSSHWADGVRHLWSLAAEEQFYLVWPPLLIAARTLSRRTLTLAVTGMLVAMWADRIALTLAHASQRRLYFAPDTSLDPIVLGCLLALLHRGGHLERAYTRPLVRRALVPLSAAAAGGLVLVVPSTDPRWLYLWGLPLFGVATAVLLGLVVANRESLWARSLERGGLPALGRISYGVYLWHPILLYAAHVPAVASIPAAIAAAAASHRLVEQRFRAPRLVVPALSRA
jgi:peptidoglycan/LPS O-acetylase OafA/YrhL